MRESEEEEEEKKTEERNRIKKEGIVEDKMTEAQSQAFSFL